MSKSKVELSLFNRTEASSYLGVDRGYINFLIEQGEILEIQLPYQTSFKGRRIPKKILDEFIERKLSLNSYFNIDSSTTIPNGETELLSKYLKNF